MQRIIFGRSGGKRLETTGLLPGCLEPDERDAMRCRRRQPSMELGLVGVTPFFTIATSQPSCRCKFHLSMGSHCCTATEPYTKPHSPFEFLLGCCPIFKHLQSPLPK